MRLNIPTKGYIRDWINHPNTTSNKEVALRVLAMVSTKTRYFEDRILDADWTEKIELQVKSYHIEGYRHRLHPFLIQEFNRCMDILIRKETLLIARLYLNFDPSIKRAVEYAIDYCNLHHDSFNPDRLFKAIQRDRTRNGGVHIYSPKNQKTIKDVCTESTQ